MLGLTLKGQGERSIACCLGEKSYSLAGVKKNSELMFSVRKDFEEKSDLCAKSFSEDVERFHLIGAACNVVLAPGQYQLLLMDALEVPEEEMAKAIRWRLKGLVDYPLNDIALDVCIVPSHGAVVQRKKIFVAVTLQSALKSKLDMLEAAYLQVSSIGIAEFSLRNLLSFVPDEHRSPIIAISLEETICQLQIFYNNSLYLTRELGLGKQVLQESEAHSQSILLEIQRSIDFCLSELKLPEPRKIIFTPSFYQAEGLLQILLQFLQKELNKEALLLDLGSYLAMNPRLSWKEQKGCFYCIGAAVNLKEVNEEVQSL